MGARAAWPSGDVSEFLHMGGHGLYVWLAYGLSFAVLASLAARPMLARRRLLKRGRRE